MKNSLSQLQLREIFHLEFLRWFSRKNKAAYAIKGGVNLRFFFNSIRYSEDMDLDIKGVEVGVLKDKVMAILASSSFQDTLMPFGIRDVITPDMSSAKQTETTQRFKIHLAAPSGEDLFTKIEFSRRGLKDGVIMQSVSDEILRPYKLAPLIVPHYNIESTVRQKIEALADRAITQARDIFDLYILSSQHEQGQENLEKIKPATLARAYENIFDIKFGQFKDTVVVYLSQEDQAVYNSPERWDDIQLKIANFIRGQK